MTHLAVGVCASMAMVPLACRHDCLPVESASGISAATARVQCTPSSSVNSNTAPAGQPVRYLEPVSPLESIALEAARQVNVFAAPERPSLLFLKAVRLQKPSLQTTTATWRSVARRYLQRVAIYLKPRSAGWSRGKYVEDSGRIACFAPALRNVFVERLRLQRSVLVAAVYTKRISELTGSHDERAKAPQATEANVDVGKMVF